MSDVVGGLEVGDDKGSTVGRMFVSGDLGGSAGIVDNDSDGVDDEVRTLPGFVKVFSRRSFSSLVMPFDVGGLLTALRFGTNIIGCLTVGSTGFEPTGCL